VLVCANLDGDVAVGGVQNRGERAGVFAGHLRRVYSTCNWVFSASLPQTF
jgi:hypothetical protein